MVADTTLIESVPQAELNGAAKPRRGRPPLTPEQKEARNARDRNRRGGGGRRAPRAAARPSRPRTPRTLYPEISAFLTMINMGVAFTPFGTKYEPTGGVKNVDLGNGMVMPIPDLRIVKLGDELDDVEIAHLAKSLDAQCQASPRFRKYVERALGVASGGGIIGIVGLIAARRAARHGLIDPSLDAKFGAMLNGDLSALTSFKNDEPSDTPDPETGELPPIPTPDFDENASAASFDDL
jgi:hypothetical protein